MHLSTSSTIFLSLLSLSTPSLAAHIQNRRHAHGGVDVDQVRREAIAREQGVVPPVSHPKKGKRLVRKKRGTCQVYNNATGPSTTSTGAAGQATTVIGQDYHAQPATTTTSSTAQPSSTSTWKLTDNWSGNSFFDHWNFWSWDDPTHGTVQYLNAGDAWNSGLISINNKGNAIMAVDTTQQISGGRKSIRIHGNKVYTGGLVIMDALHMPTGCGTWPAWWSNGPNWPYGGEIDILEGVNDFTQNQVSLHTGSGCHMPNNQNDLQGGTLTTGGYDSYNCASYETANQGCGVRDLQNNNSYGTKFNAVGGGVYALLWAKVGIKAWWFPRASIPADITADQPDPSKWGTPVANFPADNCNPYQYFYDHFNIFDTTFCGDWAGADAVWKYAGYAGQDQSCAAITGYASCSDYVRNQGSAFKDAYWEVAYVKYYNSTVEV